MFVFYTIVHMAALCWVRVCMECISAGQLVSAFGQAIAEQSLAKHKDEGKIL